MTGSRTQVFGIDVHTDFPLPGVRPVNDAGRLPTVHVRLADDRDLLRGWAEAGVRRTIEETDGGGATDRYIDEHPGLGYRLFARYYGSATVSPDGSRVACAPPPVESWRWQQFLIGRILPLAALLRGVELFHAGSVVVDDQVVAFVAPSGGGKTSLAVALALRGAQLFTDDVLAVTVTDGRLLAHPGPPVVNIRTSEEHRIEDRLSTVPLLGRTANAKAHYELPVTSGSRPVGAIGFIEPSDGAPSAVLPLRPPEPMRLLASTFNRDVQAPARLERQLDVCSRLAATVPMFRILRGTDLDADGLATLVMDAIGADDAGG